MEHVEEEVGESDELQSSADHGGGDDVVHEEGARVREEDALPAEGLVLAFGERDILS